MKRPNLGEFEELVLLAICGLGTEGYAVPIQQRIEKRARRPVTMGAVYTALDRLVEKGFITTWLGDVTRKRGGRRKRYYRLTAVGLATLREVQLARDRLMEGVDLARVPKVASQ